MRYFATALFCGTLAVIAGGCVSSPRFTAARGPVSPGAVVQAEEGVASYYADEFNGRQTSNGERYDMHQMTAAHRTLPFNTQLRVENLANGRQVVVRINDRGPFKDNRIIDLSLAAAEELEMIGTGTTRVRLNIVSVGDTTGIPQHYAQ
jgi:rare lipoprotein A